MKKITIIFMSVLMIFASCSIDTSYNNIIEKTKIVKESKEDDTKNNTEEPSNEEPKEDNSENDNDEEGNSENTEIVEESKEDDTEIVEDEPLNEDGFENNEDEPLNEEPKDDSENNTEESLNEDGSENEVVEDKTWCEISEDTKILGLNYFVCVDNSQKKLSPSINDESQAKKDTFLIRGYVSRYVEIRVGYNNKKLNFSSVSDSYIITDVMKKDSTINITIEWKNKQ